MINLSNHDCLQSVESSIVDILSTHGRMDLSELIRIARPRVARSGLEQLRLNGNECLADRRTRLALREDGILRDFYMVRMIGENGIELTDIGRWYQAANWN